MTIIIRNATIDDAQLLAKLNMSVHQPHVTAQPHRYKALTADNPELIADFEKRLSDETSYTFIAETEQEAVGYAHCFLRQTGENIYVYSLLDFHVDQLAVIESHQGQGIGKTLMEHVIQFAKDHHAGRVSLGVAAFNIDAIRFYERLGFSIGSHRMSLTIK